MTRIISTSTITYVATIYGLTASLQPKYYWMDKQMVFFKACPKCHGDMTSNNDGFGMYIGCLQCGFLKEFTESNKTCPNPSVDNITLSPDIGPRRKDKRDKSLV